MSIESSEFQKARKKLDEDVAKIKEKQSFAELRKKTDEEVAKTKLPELDELRRKLKKDKELKAEQEQQKEQGQIDWKYEGDPNLDPKYRIQLSCYAEDSEGQRIAIHFPQLNAYVGRDTKLKINSPYFTFITEQRESVRKIYKYALDQVKQGEYYLSGFEKISKQQGREVSEDKFDEIKMGRIKSIFNTVERKVYEVIDLE